MTEYRVDRDELLPDSTSPVTVIVIDWPALQGRRPASLLTTLREEIERQEEPTWEDCAWV